MKKLNFLLAAGLCLSLFVSCTRKDTLPEKPKDKQEHKDSQGNSWIYNAMLMRWALTPSGNNGVSHYYYPGNNSWTSGSGIKTNPPSGINASTYQSSSKPNSSGKSYGSSKPSSGKSFGSSHSGSRSVGA